MGTPTLPTAKELRDDLRALPKFNDATVSVIRAEDESDHDEYRVTLNAQANSDLDAVLASHGLRRIGKGADDIVGSHWNWRYVYRVTT